MTLHWTRKGTILQDFYWIAQCKTFIFIIIITYRPACAKNQSSAPLCYYRKKFVSATKPNPPQCMHANSHNDPVSLLICHTKKFLGLVIFGRFVARPQNRRETRAWERTFLNCTAVCVCVFCVCPAYRNWPKNMRTHIGWRDGADRIQGENWTNFGDIAREYLFNMVSV